MTSSLDMLRPVVQWWPAGWLRLELHRMHSAQLQLMPACLAGWHMLRRSGLHAAGEAALLHVVADDQTGWRALVMAWPSAVMSDACLELRQLLPVGVGLGPHVCLL
jgi:hypothetical protein